MTGQSFVGTTIDPITKTSGFSESCMLCREKPVTDKGFKMPNECDYLLCQECASDDPRHIFDELWKMYITSRLSMEWQRNIIRELDERKWMPFSVLRLARSARRNGYLAFEEIDSCLRSFEDKGADSQEMVASLLYECLQNMGVLIMPMQVKNILNLKLDLKTDLMPFLIFSETGILWQVPEPQLDSQNNGNEEPSTDNIDQPAEVDRLLETKLQESIESLGINPKSCKSLQGYNINTIDHLCQFTENELLAMKYIGKLRVAEIKARLEHFGLKLADRPIDVKWGKFTGITVLEDVEKVAAELLGSSFSLWKAVRLRENNWKKARDVLVRENLGLAWKAAHTRYRGANASDPVVDLEDLFQDASIGILRAVEMFDYIRGNKFSTYGYISALRYIDNARRTRVMLPDHIRQGINQVSKKVIELLGEFHRIPTIEEIAKRMGIKPDVVDELLEYSRMRLSPISIDGSIGSGSSDGSTRFNNAEATLLDKLSDDSFSIEELVMEHDAAEEAVKLKERLALLIEKSPLLTIDKSMIELRLGLKGKRQTLQEISDVYGITRERVRQRLQAAARMIRKSDEWQKLQSDPEDSRWSNNFIELITSPQKKLASVEEGGAKVSGNGNRGRKKFHNPKYSLPITRHQLDALIIDDHSKHLEGIGLEPALLMSEYDDNESDDSATGTDSKEQDFCSGEED